MAASLRYNEEEEEERFEVGSETMEDERQEHRSRIDSSDGTYMYMYSNIDMYVCTMWCWMDSFSADEDDGRLRIVTSPLRTDQDCHQGEQDQFSDLSDDDSHSSQEGAYSHV